MNYLLGLTPISLTAYVLATLIGIIPGTFAYAWLG
ncbi:MAG TPA: TVP38/TMEM64 family protein, partial [Cyanobacteria bacterium UBA11049]|nr:TVP38/TMEM64 family protein [Cyanobacteria bacterium UBA11049]